MKNKVIKTKIAKEKKNVLSNLVLYQLKDCISFHLALLLGNSQFKK